MSTPSEGLYAHIYIGQQGDCGTMGTEATVALLTGVELSWSQANKRFFEIGSLNPSDVLRGVVEWEGRFRHAYIDNYWMGTFNVGTYIFCGSITPRNASHPWIMGTIVFTGGSLSNMEAESNEAVTEDQGFIIYNLTFKD